MRQGAAMRNVLVILLLAAASPAFADDISEGKALAELNCVKCHNIEATGDSPYKDAPPFRDIPQNYGPGELEDAFNDGIVVAHPAMPEWDMTPDQARQIAAFIMSLAPAKAE